MELTLKILVSQHHPEEGSGTLGRYLEARGAELDTVHTYLGHKFPASIQGYAAMVSMGGPMNVYEEEDHPWLVAEGRLLSEAARAGLPVLGICLGAQLLAKALGAAVTRSPQEEIGWYEVKQTRQAADDPLWRGVETVIPVVQWHGDMFQVPEGGELTASGWPCPNQAFAWRKAHGLQFHLEVTPDTIRDWFPDAARQRDILGRWKDMGIRMDATARRIYDNFWGLMED